MTSIEITRLSVYIRGHLQPSFRQGEYYSIISGIFVGGGGGFSFRHLHVHASATLEHGSGADEHLCPFNQALHTSALCALQKELLLSAGLI